MTPKRDQRSGFGLNVPLGQMYTSPYAPTHTEVSAGIRAIVNAMENGALSEEQASDLIAVLLSAYAGTVVSQQVEGYLNRGLSQILQRQMGE